MTASKVLAQSIADKKAMINQNESEFNLEISNTLREVNQEIYENQVLLKELYREAEELHKYNAPEEMFKELLERIRHVRRSIEEIQEEWQKTFSEKDKTDDYSLWNHPETSLSQIIMDYGSNEHVYLIPPELSSMKLSIHSNFPIPRESWSEMLDFVLESNGIGVRILNPYLRELFLLTGKHFSIKRITNKREDLLYAEKNDRVCYILSPQTLSVKETLKLMERFSNPEHTFFHTTGKEIFIFSKNESLLELLKIMDFVESNQKEKEYKIITLKNTKAEEMRDILFSILRKTCETSENERIENSLKITALKGHEGKALFVMGSKEEIRESEKIVKKLEEEIAGEQETTLFWYTCKHSSAEELVKILTKIYPLMQNKEPQNENSYDPSHTSENNGDSTIGNEKNNFIADVKTGSILMAVKKNTVAAIKSLLKKLDIPKKMVRIEAILVEKKVKDSNHLGLNLLKMGSAAANAANTGLSWNGENKNSGILSFFMSRSKTNTGIPAYDLAYRFLLSHEDIQINASPSVTTVNQTPARIEIVEEISINTGTIVERDDHKNSVLKDAYTRAEYGIVIEITPTIHMKNEENNEEESDFITLSTDIRFDNASSSSTERPDVTKRHIKNEVRIADGQTVIIGGLRRKDLSDSRERIPFLGELPGIGKLFGKTDMNDSKTEMFIFLTPKIISDPSEDFEKIKREEFKKRPGDTTEFINALEKSREYEKRRLMSGTFQMLFGRPKNKSVPEGEYNGK